MVMAVTASTVVVTSHVISAPREPWLTGGMGKTSSKSGCETQSRVRKLYRRSSEAVKKTPSLGHLSDISSLIHDLRDRCLKLAEIDRFGQVCGESNIPAAAHVVFH